MFGFIKKKHNVIKAFFLNRKVRKNTTELNDTLKKLNVSRNRRRNVIRKATSTR